MSFPSVHLIEGVRLILLCAVIKFYAVKEAKDAKEAVLYFVQDF